MANTFVRAEKKGDVTRQLAYTAPSVLQTVSYSGLATNIDTVSKVQHTVTIEVQKVDTTYFDIVRDVPIPYGSTLKLPKFSLATGEKIYITCDVANIVQGTFSVLEIT